MDPKEKLKELESKLVTKALDRLEKMVDCKSKGKLFNNCEHAHLAEMVKVVHQLRSLLGVQ